MQWHSPCAEDVLGRWWQGENGPIFTRFPDRFKSSLTSDVWGLSTNSAGIYLKFITDSPDITVRYVLSSRSLEMWHMPSTGVSGVDLYLRDSNGKERWCVSSSRSFADTVRFNYTGMEYGGKAEFTLYLPLYNGVRYLEIGVGDSSHFSFVREDNARPVVLYGTSIVQGACASRPGLASSNILQRRLGIPVINYGFSGNGQLHDAMFAAMAEIPASVYIIDCMPNMTDAPRCDSVVSRILRGVGTLRRANSAPVVLVEHDGYMNETAVPENSDKVCYVNGQLRKACNLLLSQGFGDIYYITKEEIGMDLNSQVDGSHANDYGMMLYADAYGRVLAKLFCEGR